MKKHTLVEARGWTSDGGGVIDVDCPNAPGRPQGAVVQVRVAKADGFALTCPACGEHLVLDVVPAP